MELSVPGLAESVDHVNRHCAATYPPGHGVPHKRPESSLSAEPASGGLAGQIGHDANRKEGKRLDALELTQQNTLALLEFEKGPSHLRVPAVLS